MSTTATGEGGGEFVQKVAENPLWYHTLELPDGVVTPGQFDLRPIVDQLPWPDVSGKRCLDVGTYDGYLAFELEKRGAAEVVAADIDDHRYWDWPARDRAQGPEVLAMMAGPEKGLGFRIAKEALGSKVERLGVNIYDLNPEEHGTFDVVVCGSLMLHLRDPIRALEAIRGVCSGVFLSSEQIDVPMTVMHRRKPAFRLRGDRAQWWIPNTVGHRHMLFLAGFDVERTTRPYAIAFGSSHPSYGKPNRQERLQRMVCRGYGVPHAAALARPAL